MPQVFDKPPTVDLEDWKILESESSPEIISKATVRVIKRIKDHIADRKKKKLSESFKGNSRVRSFRRLSLKRPDKLDLDSPVSRTRFSVFTDKEPESPKKSQPVSQEDNKKTKKGRRRLLSVISFKSKC